MRRSAWHAVPSELAERVLAFERALEREASRLEEAARTFEPRLERTFAETERRITAALTHFREKVEDAARDAERKRDPRIRNYREFVAPFGRPQERVLSSLTLQLEGDEDAVPRTFALVDRHLEATRACNPSHWLVELESLAGESR
jgi:hypothetical protein